MKIEHKEFGFDNFAAEMTSLHDEKHFDYLVTIIGEDSAKKDLDVSISLRIPRLTSASV